MKNIRIFLLLILFIFNSANAEVIKNIKIENNDRVSKESIIAFGNIKLGSDYNDTQINKILNDLYDTNFFEDIKIKVESSTLIIDYDDV